VSSSSYSSARRTNWLTDSFCALARRCRRRRVPVGRRMVSTSSIPIAALNEGDDGHRVSRAAGPRDLETDRARTAVLASTREIDGAITTASLFRWS
jgi:uncharacterized protein RhaS with RHS repeats